MIKNILLVVALWYLGDMVAYACPSQIITLPDGRSMVCYYCNDGKIVMCDKL